MSRLFKKILTLRTEPAFLSSRTVLKLVGCDDQCLMERNLPRWRSASLVQHQFVQEWASESPRFFNRDFAADATFHRKRVDDNSPREK